MQRIFSFLILFFFVFSAFSMPCWKMVAKGSDHAIAVREDGTLWSWGQNKYGQLGDGSGFSTIVPIQIGTSSGWDKVYAKYDNSFAIMKDGSLWAWGMNGGGSLGDGTEGIKKTPVRIGTSTDWQSVEPSFGSTGAIKKDGSLWMWGENYNGHLGNGTKNKNIFPLKIGTNEKWKSVSIGSSFVVAIKADNTLCGWGGNYYNQLGYTASADVLSPIQIGSENNWMNVSCGGSHIIAIRTDGSLWAWGNNLGGQIGNGELNRYQADPTRVGSENNWAKCYAIEDWSIAIKTDGTLWSWGSGYGHYNSEGVYKNVPTQFGVDADWLSVYPSEEQSLAFKTDGSLWTWGSNTLGQLGLGLYVQTFKPFLISCPESLKSSCWQTVSIAEYTSIGLRTDSTLWIWGFGNITSLDMYARNSVKPSRIGTYKWKSYAFSGVLIAIKADGTLWQSGGTDIPIMLSASTDWKAVAVSGDKRGYAIKQDGSLWGWDIDIFTNNSGIYGGVIPTLTQINIGTQWQSISAAKNTAAAIRTDGTLWIWGSALYGAMGAGTAVGSSQTPLQMGTDTDWQYVSLSETATMAIKTDSTLWACGQNNYGQLGDGTITDLYALTKIGTASDWKTVVAGPFHTLAIKGDGSLSNWGSYTYDKLGLIGSLYDSTGNQVKNTWQSVAAGHYNSFGIHADGTLYTVGNNDYVQLGIENYRSTGPFALYCTVMKNTDPDVTDPVTTDTQTKLNTPTFQKNSIYPNPNNGTFTMLGSKNANVCIYNAEGRLIKYFIMSDVKDQIQMDVMQGMYYFVMKDAEGNSSSGTFIVF